MPRKKKENANLPEAEVIMTKGTDVEEFTGDDCVGVEPAAEEYQDKEEQSTEPMAIPEPETDDPDGLRLMVDPASMMIPAEDVVGDDTAEQSCVPAEASPKGSIAELIAARAAGRVLKPRAATATPPAGTVPAGERSSRVKEMIAMRTSQKHLGSPLDVIRQRIHGYSGSASVRQIIQQRRMKQ